MKKFILAVAIALMTLGLVTSAMAAPVLSGTANLSVAGAWSASVAYSVFAPNDADNTLHFSATDYVYLYDITNNAGSSYALSAFTVGALQNQVNGAGAVSGTTPSLISIGSSSTRYYYVTPELVAGAESLVWLTSDLPPVMGDGGLINHGTDDFKPMPVPGVVPEPATMSLLGMGVLGLLRLRKKA